MISQWQLSRSDEPISSRIAARSSPGMCSAMESYRSLPCPTPKFPRAESFFRHGVHQSFFAEDGEMLGSQTQLLSWRATPFAALLWPVCFSEEITAHQSLGSQLSCLILLLKGTPMSNADKKLKSSKRHDAKVSQVPAPHVPFDGDGFLSAKHCEEIVETYNLSPRERDVLQGTVECLSSALSQLYIGIY